MRRLLLPLALLSLTGLALASGGSLIPELGASTPGVAPSSVRLNDKDTADAIIESLVRSGTAGTQRLVELALEGEIAERGRAIIGLARAEGSLADDALERLRTRGSEPQLVKTWAYAASLQRAKSTDDVMALAKMQSSYPGSERAVQLAMAGRFDDASGPQLLELLVSNPAMAATLGPLLLEVPVPELAQIMLTHEDDPMRRQAAAWLAAQAQQRGQRDQVARATLAQLQHDPRVKEVPWIGGALYIPGIDWDQKQARSLVRTLIQWQLYCKRTGKSAQTNQVGNNLRSVTLLQKAGFKNRWPNDEQVLEEWARIGGISDVNKLLAEQGMER